MGTQASRERGRRPEASLGSCNGSDYEPPWPLEMDLAGGNGRAAPFNAPLPSLSQIDSSVKYFTRCNEYDFLEDPREFINDKARMFADSSSSFRKERVRAFPFTPEVIVGGIVALVRSDLDKFLTAGGLSDPESYKRPAATVIGRAKHIISLVSRTEAVDPQQWNIEKGMMLQFEFAARTLSPDTYLDQFKRVVAHTNNRGNYVQAPWERTGLVDIVGEQLGNLCATGEKSIEKVVKDSWQAHKILLDQIKFPRSNVDQIDVQNANALANLVHRIARHQLRNQQAMLRLRLEQSSGAQTSLFD